MLFRISDELIERWRARLDGENRPVRSFPSTWSLAPTRSERQHAAIFVIEEYSLYTIVVSDVWQLPLGDALCTVEDGILRLLIRHRFPEVPKYSGYCIDRLTDPRILAHIRNLELQIAERDTCYRVTGSGMSPIDLEEALNTRPSRLLGGSSPVQEIGRLLTERRTSRSC